MRHLLTLCAAATALLLSACAITPSSPAGWAAPEAVVAPSSFTGVHGLAVDRQGRLLAGSVVGNAIWTVDRQTGAASILIGGPEGQADDIAIGPKGEMAWTNYLQGSIRYRENDSAPMKVLASGLPGLNSLDFDRRNGRTDKDTIVNLVRADLQSHDALLQEAGCIILLTALDRLRTDNGKAEYIFAKLSGDEKAVNNAADIIDSRLLGWYSGVTVDEYDSDIELFTPLFYLLGIADSKTARGTLARSLLYLDNKNEILANIPVTGDLMLLSLKMLRIIEDKLCCLYPGRDFVVAILEKNSRSAMLDMFEKYLTAGSAPSDKMKQTIREFIAASMEYGDSRNGHQIRIKAVKLAGVLINARDPYLQKKVEALSLNDSYYVHRFDRAAGYSMTDLRYPVREFCLHVLSR